MNAQAREKIQGMLQDEVIKDEEKKKKKKPWKWKLILMGICLSIFFMMAGFMLILFLVMGGDIGKKDENKGNSLEIGQGIGTTTVPADVMKWEPLVRKYAQEFGVEPYVPLMLSLIMQESSGQSLDVMQSAEGAFNTKYPKIQNGITDPDYSIWCGVQEFKHSITIAKVQSPTDINRIKLALQTYNCVTRS